MDGPEKKIRLMEVEEEISIPEDIEAEEAESKKVNSYAAKKTVAQGTYSFWIYRVISKLRRFIVIEKRKQFVKRYKKKETTIFQNFHITSFTENIIRNEKFTTSLFSSAQLVLCLLRHRVSYSELWAFT